jgi:hypothetical protein
MELSTMRYLEPDAVSAPAKPTGPENRAWTEVTKGLVAVLCGYLLTAFNAAGAFALVVFATNGFRRPIAEVTGEPYTVLLVGGGLLFFTSTFSTFLLLRGKWRCVGNAPERGGARWLGFASMVCLGAATAVGLASELTARHRVVVRGNLREEWRLTLSDRTVRAARELRGGDASACLRLAAGTAAPLEFAFFVLYLRALYRHLGSTGGARSAELCLLFGVLLLVGCVALVFDPRVRLEINLLWCLAAGWLGAAVWYLLLILGAVFRISAHVNAPPAPAEP